MLLQMYITFFLDKDFNENNPSLRIYITQVNCNPCTYDNWLEAIVNSQKFILLELFQSKYIDSTTKVRWITVTVALCGF